MIRNVKLTIEYDGTNYCGWQIQPSSPTVQGMLQNTIRQITLDANCKLTGASRTDAGVHSYGQVANFKTQSNIPPDRFSYALNRLLPPDIVIKESAEVPLSFNARFDAIGKRYRYLIYNSLFRSPLVVNRAFHVSHALDIAKMQSSAKHLLGTHDFSAFQATGGAVVDPTRTLTDVSIQPLSGQLFQIEVSGDGFLYNMIRIIVGTLIRVGVGKIAPNGITDILDSRNRKMAGDTAPACGLYLLGVYYPV